MKKYLLVLIASVLLLKLNAQDKKGFALQFVKKPKIEGGIGYNFFVSPDKETAELFQTSIMGFGSGFGDLFTTRTSVDLIHLGWPGFHLSFGAGLGINKYRFTNNLVFEKDDLGQLMIYDDAIMHPERDYVNTFLGYGKSKIVYGSFFIPVHLNWTIGSFTLSAGPLIDMYISGKHKRKYILDGEKKKDKVGNSEFRSYDLNKTKTGINAFIYHKSGFTIGFTYFLTPFLSNDAFPEIREVRVVLGLKNMGGNTSKSNKKKRKPMNTKIL